MTTSSGSNKSGCYVWKWLAGQVEPVVAGKLQLDASGFMHFAYGRSYLGRDNAEPVYIHELPLRSGVQSAPDVSRDLKNFSSIRDAAPDAWGRRVIHNRLELGLDTVLSEIEYLLLSGSDRIGGLDFQVSATEYQPRREKGATLEELQNAADIVQTGGRLSPELDSALLHGTSLGGARPKALVSSDGKKYVAKFSASNDPYNVVGAEYVAMQLAALCGIRVAPVMLEQVMGKQVLLVERFDREVSRPVKNRKDGKHKKPGWLRKPMVSALTVLALDEQLARYCSYHELADHMRQQCHDFARDGKELFRRLVFNVLIGNTDDHARNHAFFVEGDRLALTPAYDLCPQLRTGGEASQGMMISEGSRLSLLTNCLRAAEYLRVPREEAREIIAGQVQVINNHFQQACADAGMGERDRTSLWRRTILSDYAFTGMDNEQQLKSLITQSFD